MKIDIINTGSDGNAILIDDRLLIDAGVSYAMLKDYDIETVLLTHIHGDHFNPSTIRKLAVEKECLFVCGDFLRERLASMGMPQEQILTISEMAKLPSGHYVVPVTLYHDVQNIGWRIRRGDHLHFHATDTAHLNGITAMDYDTATIECNYEMQLANAIIEEAKFHGEYTHLARAVETHLSVQQTVRFVQENRIRRLIPVHIGNSTKEAVLEYLKNNCERARYVQ
ncbi:MBL fold metallo-hydrolase [Hydrogenimonas urashimensis]|uniref:MBL fold metallo-hydrolase n=1 Tax=Hydrogenimonas urashimensis TaxID=2740515 RepID=UPI001916C1B0|nr:MBL fold metallo-hydrolase [Hydrogenimonas urashimensis]